MEIYNTLTKKKESFQPNESVKINMFVCGPTVYDYIHIGNARTFVFFDVVAKYLKHKYGDNNVNYIQNITDIDNKIIERADKEGVNPLELAKKYTETFKEDMESLGVSSPEYKNATDHIPQVINQVQTLLNKGNAYIIENDGIYFDLSTFPDYGKLSNRTALMADDAVSRIDDSDKKRNRGDFAIWKFKQHNDPSWSAPFGEGRPGWHIEDTAITEKYFGPQYDLHGGGQDLMFPHHEAEIAQQESASGLKPFVRYWMHGGFLINKPVSSTDRESKMSKSTGNFETAHELLKKYPKEVLRFYLLSSHYRAPLSFNETSLNQAEAGIQRINEFKQNLESTLNNENGMGSMANISITEAEFFRKIEDDFNIPEALGQFFNLIRTINPSLKSGLNKNDAKLILEFVQKINKILGIIPNEQENIPTDISRLSDQRELYRAEKNWEKSDEIRLQIESLGYKIEDTVYGPLLKKKK